MFVTPGNTDYVFYKTVLCQLEVLVSLPSYMLALSD